MKALVYEKAHKLEDFAIELVDVAEPALRDTDVLVEVRAIGVNPGEAFIRSVRSAEPGGRVLLGWEFAGVVLAAGASAGRFKAGDRVYGTGDMARDGCWAERVAVDHRILAVVPDQLSFVDAASLPIGSLTAWEAIFRGQDELPAGVDRVLILGGAGGVGSMATQILKVRTEAFVIGTGSRPESKAWSEKMGADLVLDHSGDIVEQLASAGIPSVDLVLSTAKTAEQIGWIARVLRPFGHLSVVDGGALLDVSPLLMRAASLHLEMVFSRIVNGGAPEKQGDILETIASLVDENLVVPIATTRLNGLSSETMKAAHELVESRRTIGKVVIAT
jgi:NADPH:quinone reductase